MAAVLVPVAIAFACNPQASLKLDKPSYSSGDRMGVSGAFFKPNVEITLTVDGGSPVTVQTAGNGFFATSVTAPSSPGSYTLSAIGYESDGSVTPGLPARVSFEVSPAPSPAPQAGEAPTASQPGATQPGTSAPGARQPGAGRFAEPRVPGATPFRSGERSKSPAARQRSGARQRAAVVNTGAGVIKQSSGAGVFAGSVPRAERAAAVASSGKPGAGRKATGDVKSAAPSERTALGDVWSGLASDSAPSLLPKATDAAPRSGGPGLLFVWGLALMGIALVALTAGLVGAGARRRRSRAG